jgi:Phospholipid methyltransferase
LNVCNLQLEVRAASALKGGCVRRSEGMALVNEDGKKIPIAVEVVTVLLILSMIVLTFLMGYGLRLLLATISGYSLEFGLPLFVRLLGGVLMILGFVVAGSTARYRKPREILDSTGVTLLKLFGREPLGERGARTEPFLPVGPYRWVRNPMYLGVVVGVFGLCALFSSATILLWGLVVTLWFALVLIPFEERELGALFGESYRAYKKQVPMLFPTGRRFRAGRP